MYTQLNDPSCLYRIITLDYVSKCAPVTPAMLIACAQRLKNFFENQLRSKKGEGLDDEGTTAGQAPPRTQTAEAGQRSTRSGGRSSLGHLPPEQSRPVMPEHGASGSTSGSVRQHREGATQPAPPSPQVEVTGLLTTRNRLLICRIRVSW